MKKPKEKVHCLPLGNMTKRNSSTHVWASEVATVVGADGDGADFSINAPHAL